MTLYSNFLQMELPWDRYRGLPFSKRAHGHLPLHDRVRVRAPCVHAPDRELCVPCARVHAHDRELYVPCAHVHDHVPCGRHVRTNGRAPCAPCGHAIIGQKI
jgi:hypothetical protein